MSDDVLDDLIATEDYLNDDGGNAPSSCTRGLPCSVCVAMRSELNNVAQYLEDAPHAEFARENVEALVRSLTKCLPPQHCR